MTNRPEPHLESPTQPTVACILVNWNNAADTRLCLASLAREDYPQLTVLVVDNASTDGSLEQLRSEFPWATFLANSRNDGFPKACNLGARHPLARSAGFLWLLNNDTVVPPGTLCRLVRLAETNARLGIIGSVLYFMHAPSQVQAWGGGRVSRWTAYNTHFHQPTPLGLDSYLTFASVLIRRPLFDELNGLSEDAFMYYEDGDFCLRAQAAGWQLAVAADTAILHREGGTSQPRSPRTVRLVTTAGLCFLRRHSPSPPVSYAAFVALRLGKRLLLADGPAVRAVLLGIRDFLSPPIGAPPA